MTRTPIPGALLASLAVLAVSPLSGGADAVAETRPTYGGTITAGLLSEPVHIDPTRANGHAEVTVVSLLFDTLYQVRGKDPNGQARVQPHLAAAMPELSEDRREARIRVRPGVQFHDDSRLDAGDVVASLERVHKSESAYLLAPVRAIERQGDTVVLSLSRPTPELAALLSAPATSITPRGRAPRATRVIGSGPFKLAGISRDKRRLTLAANNLYFAGRPYINKLVLRWFERGDDEAEAYEVGQSHLSLRGAVAYAGHQPKYATGEAMGPATILVYVGFGRTPAHRAITGHRDVRRALSLALARDSFRAVGTGERIAATLHPIAAAVGGPAAARADIVARPRDARAAMNRAARDLPALRARADGQRGSFELELIIDRSRPDDRKVAEKVLAALFGLGIKARISSLEPAVFAERVHSGACDLYIGQQTMLAAVPEASLSAAFALAGDDWAENHLAGSALDREQADRVFSRRLPILPLFHRALRVHHRSDVRGIQFDDSSRLGFADLFFFGRAERLK